MGGVGDVGIGREVWSTQAFSAEARQSGQWWEIHRSQGGAPVRKNSLPCGSSGARQRAAVVAARGSMRRGDARLLFGFLCNRCNRRNAPP